MSARQLPERPDLDQLKRQAKELLHRWLTGAARAPESIRGDPRLRDAQRAIALTYGFASWDALRVYVETVTGKSRASPRSSNRVLDYDDPVPDVIVVNGPLTDEVAERLAADGVTGVKIGRAVRLGTLTQLARIPTVRRIDFAFRTDLLDSHVAFLEQMPWLTAVSFARCNQITDGAVAFLRNHQHLERVNLQWTNTGDASIAALVDKPSLSRVLVGARMTDAGAARLREFPALAAVGAADAFLAVSSARTLTDDALAAIGALHGVIALDVHMSAFGSPHYTARGAAHLRRMSSLEELNFHGALADDSVLREIARIPRLRWLHCQDPVSGDAGFDALGGCLTLEHVASRVCSRMTDRGFAALARLPRLASLGLGGPRISDAAMATLTDAPQLVDLGPIMFGDAAFEHIARIPRLERLTNMYNRSTTDAATRHLQGHRTLEHYSAFGTQITDASLHVLASCARLETLEFENCGGITDAGLAAVLELPRLRRVSAWACTRVTGEWLAAVPPRIEAKSHASGANQIEGYRAETLLDYPDLPVPADATPPRGTPPADGVMARLLAFGVDAAFVEGGLRLSLPPRADARWVAVITRDAFAVPLRLQVVARPITALRIVFAAHNRVLAFDGHGGVADHAPWFMRSPAQQGEAAVAANAPALKPDEWVRVVLEVDAHQRSVYVNGVLRHTWREDYRGVRGRIGIGTMQGGELTIQSVAVDIR